MLSNEPSFMYCSSEASISESFIEYSSSFALLLYAMATEFTTELKMKIMYITTKHIMELETINDKRSFLRIVVFKNHFLTASIRFI